MPVKTAYSLSQRIRKALLGQRSPLLQGIVEIDETYIGGKPRYKGTKKRGRGTEKPMVAGMVQRDGDVIAQHMDSYKANDVRKFVMENIDLEQSEIHTDEYSVQIEDRPVYQSDGALSAGIIPALTH